MEADLDVIILERLNQLLASAELRLQDIDRTIDDRLNKQRDYLKQSERSRINIHKKEEEIKGYSRQLAQGLINEKLFRELTEESTKELTRLEGQLAESGEYEKEKIVKSIDVLR